MDTDNIRFREGGLVPARDYICPGDQVIVKESINNEYFKNGEIFCWVGDGEECQRLTCVDEKSLDIKHRTDVPGYSAIYVADDAVLFAYDDYKACLIDTNSFKIVLDSILVLPVSTACYRAGASDLLIDGIKSFGLYSWPECSSNWVYRYKEISCDLIVQDQSVYFVHTKGVVVLDLYSGEVLWEMASENWCDQIRYKGKPLKKAPKIDMEKTGIYNDILVLSFNGGGMAGLNVKTRELDWTLDIKGPKQLTITQDGIGWFKTGYTSIQRLDVAKGVLLPEMHFQFAPVLESESVPRVGAFDISNTHLIADAAVPTDGGKQGYIIGINRETGVVDWAVPIPVQGMLTKLFVLNNRVYATGTTIDPDTNEVRSKMFVIEGEGGFRLD